MQACYIQPHEKFGRNARRRDCYLRSSDVVEEIAR